MQDFTKNVIEIIQHIPKGKVITYKLVSEIAGSSNSSRQVARILHSCTEKYQLPWYRVINTQGKISLPKGGGYEVQSELLGNEGVYISLNGTIDFEKYLWNGAYK